jgi:hypothetical protein
MVRSPYYYPRIRDNVYSPEFMRHDDHDKFVCASAQQECDEHRCGPGELVAGHRWCVYVTKEKCVYRFVPLAREFVP